MEKAFENIFRHASSVHRRVVPSRDDETDSILNDHLCHSARGLIEDQPEVVFAQETVGKVSSR